MPRGRIRTYANDFQNNLFICWHRARSQAHYRKEQWELSIEDWFYLWQPDLWARRGKTRNSLCMVRIDRNKSWNLNNVQIITRLAQLRDKNKHNIGRKIGQNKWRVL